MKLLLASLVLMLALVEIHGYWGLGVRVCHKCKKRKSHAECLKDGIEICKKSYDACGTYIETDKKGKMKITKGCLKSYNAACVVQNNCRGGNPNQKYCWYCCHSNFCNVGNWPQPPGNPCRCKPCMNGGTCVPGQGQRYTCRCRPGWGGPICGDRVDRPDPCRSNPCRNGGTCRSCNNRWNCDCPPRFTGRQCETRIDPCRGRPCKNGGTCRPDGNGFKCNCRPNFTGPLCGREVNPCRSNPCRNGGTCNSHQSGFTCSCRPGYTGRQCETATPCFRCPTQSGLFPDRLNCRKFYHCAHWIPYHKDCPAELHFNARLKVCDWPNSAGCTPMPRDSNTARSMQDCEGGNECLVDQSSDSERPVRELEEQDPFENQIVDVELTERDLGQSDPFENPMDDIGLTERDLEQSDPFENPMDDIGLTERELEDSDPFENPMDDIGLTGEGEKIEQRETVDERVEDVIRELDGVIAEVDNQLN